jgi:hypothetical protein
MAQRNSSNGFARVSSEAAARRWALGLPAKGRKSGDKWPLSIYLPADLGERLGKMALATEENMSDIITFATELYVEEHFGNEGDKLPTPQRERLERKWAEITQAPKYREDRAKRLEELAKIQANAAKEAADLISKASK